MSAWRLEYALQADASALAARTHSWLIANNAAYSRSVTAGQTLRWAIPYQDGALWCTNIKDRSFNALSAAEQIAAKVITGMEATAMQEQR